MMGGFVAYLAAALPVSAAPPNCVDWEPFELLATCDDCAELNESSGVVPAKHREGVWFTHNDAGGSADLYAFDTNGVHLETHDVVGGGFRDWEDIASGPCPPGVEAETCIYIGDVGDNGETREEVDIWVVAEPEAGASAEVVANWRLRYPVAPHDCEAIVVHPCTGRVYLITKERDGEPVVFRVPAEPTGLSVAADVELVASLPIAWFEGSGLVTGADWSEGGDRLVVRTYDGGWIWQTDPADPDAHWSTAPEPIPIDVEGQGESIAFHPDGGVLTTTERTPMRIVHLPCASTEDAAECPPPEPEDTGEPPDTGPQPDTADSAEPDTDAPGDTDEPADTAPEATDSSAGGAPTTPEPASKDACGCSGGAGAVVALGWLWGLRRRRSASAGSDPAL